MTPSERTMPVLDARPDGSGWRLAMPGGTFAWLPSEEACRAAARSVWAAVRFVTAKERASGWTEAELREAWGR